MTRGEGEQVREFHETFGMPAPEKPGWVNERHELRMDLINEEIDEFDVEIQVRDLPKAVKEACDIIYVLHGWMIENGIDSDAAFAEVHRSNMSKVWDDGTVKYREDGKVLKPPTYSPADIEGVLGL